MCATFRLQPMNNKIKFAYFGSSKFSEYVLNELKKAGFEPALNITDAKAPLPELTQDIDMAIVASFGKILPAEYLKIPKFGFLNVHPSLLPKFRGPSPIQAQILNSQANEVGVTIIKMDEKMDHGPILSQRKVVLNPWPDHYGIIEALLGQEGGLLLAETLPKWLSGEIGEKEQAHEEATFVKMIKKEDGLLNLGDEPEANLRKVLAYSTWPGAYIFFRRKQGDEIRVVVRNAKIVEGQFIPTRVIPAGKKEMDWESFLRGNA